jgi:copper homeostasis protein
VTGVGVLVEVTVDSVESARAAEAGGAARVELCAGLVEGGTTPSPGMIEACREQLAIPFYVLVRPRGGDFLYGPAEYDVMRRDIAQVKRLGADGVVLGALRRDAAVDAAGVRSLVEAARPLAVTFHRAIDFTRDAAEALDVLVALGVERVLTSGGAATAFEGIPALTALVRQGGDAITIVAAGGISEDNVAHIVDATGVREVHVRAAAPRDSGMTYRRAGLSLIRSTPGQYAWYETDVEQVRLVVEALER